MLDFEGALFDLDGTLLDSMWVWAKIDEEFLSRRGIEVPPDYFHTIAPMTFRQTAEYTRDLFGLKESPEEIMAEWNLMAMDAYVNKVGLKPYAKEYLKHLKENGIKLGTVTSLPDILSEPVLRRCGIYHLFDAFTTTDEVNRGKSNPCLYILAARKLGVSPEKCVVFEDTLDGVKGILAAGMRAWGVYDIHYGSYEDEMKELCEVYVRDFRQLLPLIDARL